MADVDVDSAQTALDEADGWGKSILSRAVDRIIRKLRRLDTRMDSIDAETTTAIVALRQRLKQLEDRVTALGG